MLSQQPNILAKTGVKISIDLLGEYTQYYLTVVSSTAIFEKRRKDSFPFIDINGFFLYVRPDMGKIWTPNIGIF